MCGLQEDVPVDAESIADLHKRKYGIISTLLKDGAKVEDTLKENENTPLHWAFFYGDKESGLAIFVNYPMIVFRKNYEDQNPFEVALSRWFSPLVKAQAIELAVDISKLMTNIQND